MVVAARDEADRIAATLAGLAEAFPGANVLVADDRSTDATAAIAGAAGARVVGGVGRAGRRRGGKGQAMTLGVAAAFAGSGSKNEGAARAYARARWPIFDRSADWKDSSARIPESGAEPVLVLCDGDLGESARELDPLVDAVRKGETDLAIAAFSTREGGGLGLALTFARWAVRRRCGLTLRAPLSGQRAMRMAVLDDVVPFASGYGMEIGMTIDAVRAGHNVTEVELPVKHRPTGRQLAGFLHRARQLASFVRVYVARR